MTTTFVSLFVLFVELVTPSARAQTQVQASCWGDHAALNVEATIKSSFEMSYLSIPEYRDGHEPVAQLIVKVDPQAIVFETAFSPNQPELGNPINIYAIMILSEGKVLRLEDFTDGCTNPGISFFPSQKVQLLTLKDPPSDRLQIIIWARR